MSHRLIYLVGQPGAGKSTLMAALTADYDRVPARPPDFPVAHDQLVNRITGAVIGAEIGILRDAFSGTDALPSAVIDKAVPWIQSRPYDLMLGEGARLGNKRFITAAVNAGYDVTLALLEHDEAEDWRAIRSKALKRTQNESWVRGRATASRNLADAFDGATITGPGLGRVRVWRGHPDRLREGLSEIIADG